MFVYVGTFTREGGAEGIYVYRMDPVDGSLAHVQTVPGLISPSFLALHPQQPVLYTVERHWTPEEQGTGAVAAWAIDPVAGTLALLNRVRSQGVSPAYVSVHPSGRFVFAAHYVSGQVAAFPIQPGGHLGEATDVVQHHGRGPNAQRQEGPHAHFITPDPAGRYVLSCDLGVDKVLVYRLDAAAGKLLPNEVSYGQVGSGEGPRHLAFHPSGRFVYVINEIGSSLSVFAYDGERGTLTHGQTVPTIPDDFAGDNSCAQVIVHPDGRFVYGSNRGHDSIAIFAIDQQSGKVRPVGHQPTQGQTPRNFNVDPTGTLLLAANERSDTIVAFRVDRQTGALTPTGQVLHSPSPVCIVFRPV